MPTYTTNYNLKKPASDEFYNIQDFNDNADLIDVELKQREDDFNSLNAMTTQGDILYYGSSSPTRLAKGNKGQVLAMNNEESAPEWVNPFAQIVTKTDSFTLSLNEANSFVKCNKATAMNCTVPPNSSVAFVVGTEIELFAYGVGTVTVVPGSGVTIRSKDSNLIIDGQYAGAALKKIGTDEWVLVGSLTS